MADRLELFVRALSLNIRPETLATCVAIAEMGPPIRVVDEPAVMELVARLQSDEPLAQSEVDLKAAADVAWQVWKDTACGYYEPTCSQLDCPKRVAGLAYTLACTRFMRHG